jgi:hypothetical protein
MTLDEAIKHCEEKSCDSTQCSQEHKQLAEWLKELECYKEMKNEIQIILDSPLTDWVEIHAAIQDILNKY